MIKNSININNNEIKKINDEFVLERIKNIPKGGYYEHLPNHLKTKKIRNGKEVIVKRYGSYFRRLDPKKTSITITNNPVIHPEENRYLTNREKAILHTFPISYKFYGTESSISQQIANAVPPRFSELLSKKLEEFLI